MLLACSALSGQGIDTVWETVEEHRLALEAARVGASDAFAAKRAGQQVRWMWAMVRDRLMAALEGSEAVRAESGALEAAVAAGETTPALAAERLLRAFGIGG